jgi:hypothetical protein
LADFLKISVDNEKTTKTNEKKPITITLPRLHAPMKRLSVQCGISKINVRRMTTKTIIKYVFT